MYRRGLLYNIKNFVQVLIEEITDINIELLIHFNIELNKKSGPTGGIKGKVNKYKQNEMLWAMSNQVEVPKVDITDIIADLKKKLENDSTLINVLKPRNKFMLKDLLQI